MSGWRLSLNQSQLRFERPGSTTVCLRCIGANRGFGSHWLCGLSTDGMEAHSAEMAGRCVTFGSLAEHNDGLKVNTGPSSELDTIRVNRLQASTCF